MQAELSEFPKHNFLSFDYFSIFRLHIDRDHSGLRRFNGMGMAESKKF